MYKALKNFTVPNKPAFKAGEFYNIGKVVGRILENRGLVTSIVKKEKKVSKKSNLQKAINSNL